MSIINELKTKINELQEQINQIQRECSHPKAAVISKSDSNTGNYDPSADSWWIDHYCTLCEKRWRVDQ